jgi:hypothetical protein
LMCGDEPYHVSIDGTHSGEEMDVGKYLQWVDSADAFAQYQAFAGQIGADDRSEMLDAAELAGWHALKNYEAGLLVEFGQHLRAEQVRLMVAQLGMVRAIERIVLQRAWNACNSLELHAVCWHDKSFEKIVIRYPGLFCHQALALAQAEFPGQH